MKKFAVAFVHLLSCAFAIPVTNETDWRIVGGSDAPDGAYPYQISIRSSGNTHLCGGSIISPSWILTAAHCVMGLSSSDIVIVAGTNQLNAGGTRYQVSRIIPHSGFDRQTAVNDIALIKVSDQITYGPKVQAIPLISSALPAGSSCVLSGWGLTSFPSDDSPNNLQHINLRTISTSQCQEALPDRFPVTDSHVCTYTTVGQGACSQDSGGPLVSAGQQIGIVSWGIRCATGKPDVFASVAAYRDWIRKNSGI